MTKRELAQAVAIEMKKVKADVDVERMTRIFAAQRTKHELEVALYAFTK